SSRAEERAITERADAEATLASLRWMLAAVIALAAGTTALAARFMLRRELSPLETLAAEVQRIDVESPASRVSHDALPAELETIGAGVNDLLDRMQRVLERERRFNAMVAHELRAPIAELFALTEIALRWPEDADLRESMTHVAEVARSMQS